MSKKIEMKSQNMTKIPKLKISDVPEHPKGPLMKPCENTYVVRIIRAYGPHSSNEALRDIYRIRVWPENLEIMSRETKWVMPNLGLGDPFFDQSFTFNLLSSVSTLMVVLEMSKIPIHPAVNEIPDPLDTKQVHKVGIAQLTLPAEVRKSIEVNEEIFDEEQSVKGSIRVSLVKQK